jgi:hypothetical protein
MRALHERPRLVVARLLAVAVVLGIGAALGELAGGGPEVPPEAQARLDRAAVVSIRQGHRLDQTGTALARVRAEMTEAFERSRTLTDANSRLRRELRSANRELRRERRAERARAR